MPTPSSTDVSPKIIKDHVVLHRVSFDSGPRIERIQHVEYLGKITVVELWYEGGKLHHVSARDK